jgi:hypothetical protein
MNYDLKITGGTIAVIVNGRVVRRAGRDVVAPDGPLPGKLLRNG